MNHSLRCCILLLCAVLALPLISCKRMEESVSSSAAPSSASQPEDERKPDFPIQVFDAEIAQRPERVVSLSPALTELLCAFGYEDRLYGVSDFCDYPDSVLGIANCGSALNPNWEQIAELSPDYLLTETPMQQSDYWELYDLGVTVVEIPAPEELGDIFALYQDICLLMDGASTGQETGALLAQGYRQQLESLAEKVAQEPLADTLSAVFIIDPDIPIVAEGGSIFHELLSVLGLQNMAENGLPEDIQPDLALYGDRISPKEIAASERFGALEAARLIQVPLAPLERCSPRMFDMLDQLANEIYARQG